MRVHGFYWVMYCGEWVIAEWGAFGDWYLSGVEPSVSEDDIDEVDERRIVRGG